MAKEIVPEIKKNYDVYNQLLKEKKSIHTKLISISQCGNNTNIMEKEVDIKLNDTIDKTTLVVAVKAYKSNFFQFKLNCKKVFAQPFFRFDSDGSAHRNYIDDVPVEEQLVSTPHFHYYNKDGVNVAYKTEALKNDTHRKALEDISMCLSHFFQESNIEPDFNDTVEVRIMPEKLPFDTSNINPHANIIFP